MKERLGELKHIGIAVEDLDEAKKVYCDVLGFDLEDEMEVPERGLRIAFLSAGNAKIELLKGISPDSTISKFVEKRGAGIHHLCFGVVDIKKTIEGLMAEGIALSYCCPLSHSLEDLFLETTKGDRGRFG